MPNALNIMTRNVVIAEPCETIDKIYQTMKNKDIRHIPVCFKEKLIGIVSESDILVKAYISNECIHVPAIPASAVMVEDVITCSPGTTISELAGIMIKHGINCLPVTHNGKMVGIVTTSDLLDQFCMEIELNGNRVMPLTFLQNERYRRKFR